MKVDLYSGLFVTQGINTCYLIFQVYIVAMEGSGSAPYARDFPPHSASSLLSSMASSSFSTFSEEDGPSSGNLLALVQPELTTLAHHWLSALRDHALLSLPPGYYIIHSLSSSKFRPEHQVTSNFDKIGIGKLFVE